MRRLAALVSDEFSCRALRPQKRAVAKFHADESDCVYGGDGERGFGGDGRNVPGCSRLSCIKSAIECLVHREFHRHKRPARGVSHKL